MGLVFSNSNFFINKIALANKRMSFSCSNSVDEMNNQSVFGRLSTSDLAAVHWNYAHFCWLANLFNIQDEAEALDWLIFWNLVKLKGVCAKTVNNSSKQVCTSHQITQNKLSALNRRFWFEDWWKQLNFASSKVKTSKIIDFTNIQYKINNRW